MDGVCHDCRGEMPPAFPRKPHRGAASLVHRYYWREIYREVNHRFIERLLSQGVSLVGEGGYPVVSALSRQYRGEYEEIERSVVSDIRSSHVRDPKYDFTRPSDSEILTSFGVAVDDYPACYVTPTIGHVEVLPVGSKDLHSALSVEEFVAGRLREAGRQVMLCESRPIHALYGTLMWLWVQDPRDSHNRAAGFGGRDENSFGQGDLIWTVLPDDFGSPRHATRRASALRQHLDSLPRSTDELLWLFDYWTSHSQGLLQYLWAHREVDIVRGRRLIEILGPERVVEILGFLAGDYWGRYLGWPDLVSWLEIDGRVEGVEFVEVKSSSDKLSEDQRDWIAGNAEFLQLSFKIAKVHRAQQLVRP
ncbi:VRR-NUC domain-containing protein [Streptomyces sp. NPDC058326]|uniref:VRR-NUC domain-containing protein n=1 Tax=Streptomyces sp. NPDC058326 TaxID=3346447 RepID=UPI0036EE36FB